LQVETGACAADRGRIAQHQYTIGAVCESAPGVEFVAHCSVDAAGSLEAIQYRAEALSMKTLSSMLRPILAVALMAALPAQAGTVIVNGWASPEPVTTVRIRNANPSLQSQFVQAAAFSGVENATNIFLAWCVDIFQPTRFGNTVHDFSVMSGQDYFGLQPERADLLGRLATRAFGESLTGGVNAGAFQLAIWEIVNEKNDVLDLGSGNFGASRASDGSIALAQEWLSSLPMHSRYSFDVLASPTHQDLAVFRALPSALRSAQANGVPEPGTLALSALAFGGLAVMRRRMRASRFSAAV
jgi:hypothetical protein